LPRRSVITILLLCIAGFARGDVIVVPDDEPTIQAAIDAASGGDVILVMPGVYKEHIDFMAKAVTVKSDQGPEVTTIEGTGTGSVVLFQRGEEFDTVLEGFTITNGTGSLRGSNRRGGGIACGPFSSPTITGNVIVANSADYGGGIACFESSGPLVTNNVIEENFAQSEGGGIDCDNASCPAVTGNTISGNTAHTYGGAIRCSEESDARIEGNAISGNTASTKRGGAIYCYRSSPAISGNTITGNWSEKCGGALYGRKCSSSIEDNIVIGNTSHKGYGGAFNFSSYSLPLVTANVIMDNTAYTDGGINCYYHSDAVIADNIIAGNSASLTGGGINCLDESDPTILNNTVTANTAGSTGGGISLNLSCSVVVTNTILWNNRAPRGNEAYIGNSSAPSAMTISYCDVKGGFSSVRVLPGCTLITGPGNIAADPRFVEREAPDYHLTVGSPCRDAGDDNAPGLPSFDFEGDPRRAGGRVDMGADEFHHHLYVLGKTEPGEKVILRVIGPPGKSVFLGLGSGVLDFPVSTPRGTLYLPLPLVNSWMLGRIDDNGVISLADTIPASWIPGDTYPFQALVGLWGGTHSRLTNLLVLTVK